jgi:hypothetical protein
VKTAPRAGRKLKVPSPGLKERTRAPAAWLSAPRPYGPLSGKRTRWRRAVARGVASINRAADRLPFGPWMHRCTQRGLTFDDVPIRIARAGPALRGLTVAFLSDLHAGSFMGEADLCRIFAEVQRREPDLVCLGGDLINTREREVLLFREPLRLLRPPLGVWAVPGNHDHFYGSDIGLWEAFLHEQGVRVLMNRGERILRGGDSLWLAGVDDLTEGDPSLRAALAGRRDDEPALLLAHHPDFFFEAAAAGVDLQLSGHTHGGQAKFFGWAPIRHSRFGYERGLFEEAGSQLYVSRGVGVTLLPLRLDAPAQVPIVRIV